MLGIRVVFGDTLYRAFFLVLLFQGVAGGATFPLVSLWATHQLGADPVQAGLLRTVAGLTGVVYGLLLGATTDRTLRRRPWIIGGIGAGVVARAGMAATDQYVIGAGLYALASLAGFTLMFGQLGDWLRHRREPNALAVTSTIRLAFAIGWLLGPLGGSALVDQFGYMPLFAGASLMQGLSLLAILRWLHDAPAPAQQRAAADGSATSYWPLALYTVAMLFTAAAEPARFVVLPLYVTEALGSPVTQVGLLFTIGGLCELPLFLTVGRMADRVGVRRFMLLGFAVNVVYFAGLALSRDWWQLAAVEPLFSFAVAATNGIGILYVQNLQPRRAGTALALYGATYQLGPVLSSPAIGYLATSAGWSSAFALSAGLAALSILFFWLSTVAQAKTSSRTG